MIVGSPIFGKSDSCSPKRGELTVHLEHSVVLAELLIEYTVISHGPFFSARKRTPKHFRKQIVPSADRVVLKDKLTINAQTPMTEEDDERTVSRRQFLGVGSAAVGATMIAAATA